MATKTPWIEQAIKQAGWSRAPLRVSPANARVAAVLANGAGGFG
jgi:hypothetical protein